MIIKNKYTKFRFKSQEIFYESGLKTYIKMEYPYGLHTVVREIGRMPYTLFPYTFIPLYPYTIFKIYPQSR